MVCSSQSRDERFPPDCSLLQGGLVARVSTSHLQHDLLHNSGAERLTGCLPSNYLVPDCKRLPFAFFTAVSPEQLPEQYNILKNHNNTLEQRTRRRAPQNCSCRRDPYQQTTAQGFTVAEGSLLSDWSLFVLSGHREQYLLARYLLLLVLVLVQWCLECCPLLH